MIIILFEDIEEKGATFDKSSPPENNNAEIRSAWYNRAISWLYDIIGIKREPAGGINPDNSRQSAQVDQSSARGHYK
jgi:hypothetical protein